MSDAAYLVDNPPRIRQYRRPRRATPSGVVVVHTAESFPDETEPDTGAENVARFIRDRTNYGSYHDLADSDSDVYLVPYDAEAFGDGTGSNPHAYHVSAATQAHKWDQVDDEWADNCVRNMARVTARYARWLSAEHGITIPARRITRAQSDARVPGFISHAQRDPRRRTDPGAGFPWTKYLAYYADQSNTEEFDMDEQRLREIIRQEIEEAWSKKYKVPSEGTEKTRNQLLIGGYDRGSVKEGA